MVKGRRWFCWYGVVNGLRVYSTFSLSFSLPRLSVQTSKEIDVLLQVHLELQSERDQLLNVSKRVDAIPDDIYSTHFWLVLAQFAVVVLVLLVCCVWLCHIKCVLERKLNTIQRTLSSLQNPPILKNSSLDRTRDVKLVKSGMKNGDDSDLGTKLCERTKSTSPTHSRSFSLTSVSDLSKKTENIGDLSRPEINSLSSQKSRGYREELLRPRSATGLASGGALSSYSLSSLDDRKQTEVSSKDISQLSSVDEERLLGSLEST